MKRILNITLYWLLIMAAFCSCSMEYDRTEGDKTINIAGTITDLNTKRPIEGVKVIFNAFDLASSATDPIMSINVYTGNQGTFSINAEGFNRPVECVVITDHKDYISLKKDIRVNWKGLSFDSKTNTFYINNCDFHLEKIR